MKIKLVGVVSLILILSCGKKDDHHDQPAAQNAPGPEAPRVPPPEGPLADPPKPGNDNPPPENPPPPAPDIGTKTVWTDVEQPILQKCATCHKAGGKRPLNNPDLIWKNFASREDVLESIQTALLDGTMPPKESPQLTEVESALIIKWVDEGGLTVAQ